MGLEDRDYMRAGFKRPGSGGVSVVTVLLVINVVIFVAQLVTAAPSESGALRGGVTEWFQFSLADLTQFRLWGLVTHQFVHGHIGHIVVNMLALWFIGRFVERLIGARHFLAVYFLGGIAGALLWAPTMLLEPPAQRLPLVGASGAILGLLGVAAVLAPNTRLLLFFVIPMRLRTFVIGFAVASVVFKVVGLMPGFAHMAHVGGIVAGVLYGRFVLPGRQVRGGPGGGFGEWFHHLVGRFRQQRRREPLRQPKTSPSASDLGLRFVDDDQDGDGADGDPLTQVDPILDKISRHGMKSLTRRELEILDRAKDKLRNERP